MPFWPKIDDFPHFLKYAKIPLKGNKWGLTKLMISSDVHLDRINKGEILHFFLQKRRANPFASWPKIDDFSHFPIYAKTPLKGTKDIRLY